MANRPKLWDFLGWFNNHRTGGNNLDDRGVTCFDEIRVLFFDLPGFRIKFLLDFFESACDLCSVTVEDRRVSFRDDGGMVQHHDLCDK